MTKKQLKLPTKAIITDAGDGTRCIPFTKDLPKGRLPLGGLNSAVELIAKECLQANIEEIMLVVRPCDYGAQHRYFNECDELMRRKLVEKGKTEQIARLDAIPKITVIPQMDNLPYGNAAPIISCLNRLDDDESVIVCYGDDVTFGSSDIQSLLDSFSKHPDADAIIMAQEVASSAVSKFGMIKLKESNLLDHIVEKPTPDQTPSLLASYGRYLLTPSVLRQIPKTKRGKGDEIWTVDSITKIAQTGKVYVEQTRGRWMTTGDEPSYIKAFIEYAIYKATMTHDQQFIVDLSKAVAKAQTKKPAE